jgi:hypothetical protein
MSVVMTGWSSEGDDKVNAADGPVEATNMRRAPAAAAASAPLGTRRETTFLHASRHMKRFCG